MLALAAVTVFLLYRSCHVQEPPAETTILTDTAVQTEHTAKTETSARNGISDSTETAFTVPDNHCIENVPHILQKKAYPTGCESVAAVSLLQYYGADITVETFIDQYLPCADYPYYDENDVMHGESPWEYFIGDPYSESGYGCYSPPILEAMCAAAPAHFEIGSVRGASLQALCEDYVAKGNPVLIWATMYMLPPEEGRTWLLPSGESYTFIRPEHALLLSGYDAEYYYFSDSLSEETVTAYPKEDCEIAYEALYSQAITVHAE